MKKIILAMLVYSFFCTPQAWADKGMVVVDVQTAILNTELAKEKIAEMKKKYAPDYNELKELGQVIQGMRQRLEQDAAVMSEAEKRALGLETEGKIKEYQFKAKQLQNAQNNSQQELLTELKPKLDAALKQLLQQKKYTLILHARAALYHDKSLDITNKVTELLNQK